MGWGLGSSKESLQVPIIHVLEHLFRNKRSGILIPEAYFGIGVPEGI